MTNLEKIFTAGLIYLLSTVTHAVADDTVGSCAAHIGHWLEPNSGNVISGEAVFDRLARARIVLLGEAHTSIAHHRWQAYMLAALHSRNSNMMVGFEMLPRSKQAVLNAWSNGELSEAALLEQTDWQQVWGYDASYYLPLLHFARMNRLPVLALNVDRDLVAKVGEVGWRNLPEAERRGIADPAPASAEYRRSLAEVYTYKQSLVNDTKAESNLDAIEASPAFARFVDAQLTWDRAMAEVLAVAHRRDPQALVVGIVGRGHLEFGYGIPSQLTDMGIDDVDVLLPVDAADSCDPLPADLASAIFVVDVDGNGDDKPRPRLGVMIESGADGVMVRQVIEPSVAVAVGLRQGDVIQRAAGFETRTSAELIAVIQRQAPGTWLPLAILRDGKSVELIAKFPQSFE